MSGRSLVGGGVALGVHDGGPDESALAHDVRLRGRRGSRGVFRFARASVVSCAVFAGLAGVSTSVSAALWANASSMVVRGSNGLPITVRMPEALASVSGGAAGTGGAVARASVPVVVGGVTAALELSKAVPAANLAKVARVAARAVGPLALAGLVYDGVSWVNDEWVKPGPDGPELGKLWRATVVGGSYNSAAWGSLSSCVTASPCSWSVFEAAMISECQAWAGPGNSCQPIVTTSIGGPWRWTQEVRNSSGAYVANFIVEGSSLGDDPNPSATVPASDSDLEISFQQGLISASSSAAAVLDAATSAAPSSVAEFGSEPVLVSGPATLDGGTRSSSTVGPNGTVTTTVHTTYNFDYSGNTVNVTETQVTTVTDGNGSTVTTTTTQVPPSAEAVSPSEPAEDVECGLPGTPACKIDETGTPTGEDVRSQGDAAIQEGYDAIEGGISGLGDAPVDDLGWSWSFEFPAASCSALVINFRSYSRVVDWCPILGQMRAIWGWAVGVMGALFVWRRATSPM